MMNQFSDRLRFNWGYHNGANPYLKDFAPKANHFDAVYVEGWWQGWGEFRQGCYQGNSDNAWQRYQAKLKHAKAERKSRRNATPETWIQKC